MTRYAQTFAVVAMALALSGPARAGEQPEIRFAPGATSAVIEGAVGNRDRDIHPFTARAGQRLRVTLTSTQGNAVFDAYQPGTSFFRDEDDIWTFRGDPLRGAEAGRDSTVWEGVLPRSGRYLIVVGPTRMGAAYSLRVEVE